METEFNHVLNKNRNLYLTTALYLDASSLFITFVKDVYYTYLFRSFVLSLKGHYQ